MASNAFGKIFKITTFGESHGKAVGVIIDGCPAGLQLEEGDIDEALACRAPGKSAHTSPRKEPDRAEILSGLFEGKTTGAPLTILIRNQDADSSHYEPVKDLLKPGHANYTYLEKYGCFDHRGGGRASARETACRVAAGAVALKLLEAYGIPVGAYLKQVGSIEAFISPKEAFLAKAPLFCPDEKAASSIVALLEKLKEEGDSIGGIVEFIVPNLPSGLGDPVYEKLEAVLAHALMGLPAAKGFEIGSGFQSVLMRGSSHNDRFLNDSGKVQTETNWAGGTLGGISTGMPLIGRVAFKPASSIKQAQATLTKDKEEAVFVLPEGSRHDPCVAVRAVPVVRAMVGLTLIDALLMNRCVKV